MAMYGGKGPGLTPAMPNEVQAGALINATSTGDVGGRSTDFLASSLPSGWVQEASAPAATVVGYSSLLVGPSKTGPAAATHYLQPYTPSGNFRIEARVRSINNGVVTTPPNGVGIFVRDSGTGDAAGDGVWVGFNSSSYTLELWTLDAGVWTKRLNEMSSDSPDVWRYIALQNVGGLWHGEISVDRNWLPNDFGTYSKAFTVAKGGLRFQQKASAVSFNAACDFWDVVT